MISFCMLHARKLKKLSKAMFKNERWSEIGKLKTATHRLNALYVDGQFFINGHKLRLV